MRRNALVAVLAFSLAAAAVAQTTPATEFGRASGGEIEAITKQSSRLSGSLGVTASKSEILFGGKGFNATLGGTLIKDRVWFFASAERSNSIFGSPYTTSLPASPATAQATNAKLTANLGDRQTLAAAFAGQDFSASNFATTPSSFLNLHYTGIISDNMFFTATMTQSRRTRPAWLGGAGQ